MHVPLNGRLCATSRVLRRKRGAVIDRLALSRRGGRLSARLSRGAFRARRAFMKRGRNFHPRVLVMRSGSSVHHVLTRLFRKVCRIAATIGKRSTLRGMRRTSPRVVLDSILVPHVSNVRLIGRLGKGLSAYRVPIILLATHARVRRGLRKLGVKTSSCVAGPFSSHLLMFHYGGLIGGHHGLRRCFAGRPAIRAPILTAGPLSGRFLSRIVTMFRRRLSSSSFAVSVLTRRVLISHAEVCTGVGTVANRAPGSFFVALQLGGTTFLLQGGPRLGMARVSSRAKFDSPHCFDGLFGGTCRLAPVTCQRKRR